MLGYVLLGASSCKFAEHIGVIDNQLLFGVLEPFFSLFSALWWSCWRSNGAQNVDCQGVAAISFLGSGEKVKAAPLLQRNALPGPLEGCDQWRENDQECCLDQKRMRGGLRGAIKWIGQLRGLTLWQLLDQTANMLHKQLSAVHR